MSRKINLNYGMFAMSTLLVLSAGCSNTSSIQLGNKNKTSSDNVINAVINVPRAIMASDACKNGAEQDKQKCLAERQAETDELSQAIKNRTKK
ncbi:hypothetical protein [Shewanella marina]|uniref:hypothetical protein n=1 Tax=Shewanella marina TaxID=487319 RepID=UPI000470D733|nr:hypothetical protein [Shewanella marina]